MVYARAESAQEFSLSSILITSLRFSESQVLAAKSLVSSMV